MIIHLIQFVALFLLMLVTGIFWGPWFSLHRSLKVFKADEFIRIVKTIAANLAVPMRILMPSCILCMMLSVWFYPQKDSIGFVLNAAALCFTIISLLITLLVEVPIVSQILSWTTSTMPENWEMRRNRWVNFHVIRTFSSLVSFACFAASIFEWKSF